MFRKTIWESNSKKILLTFDDGPNFETTPLILNKLNKHFIKAVFFCVGENVKENQALAKRIVEEGHTIANHTMSHKNINLFNGNVKEEIKRCSETIEEVTGESPKYFRPPHGRIGLKTEKILEQLSLKNVMWSLLTADYKNDFNILKFAVDNYLIENSIIVLHDSVKSGNIIEEAIDYIVDSANEKGYTFGDSSECLK
jgi:peptidoglycan/xylan/chitin deacetylase (PgdA/CDA1 family)